MTAEPPRIVVGAAVVHRGRVLAARRSAPPELAGGWEFPGGKVEPGEAEPTALVRECREELGIGVRPCHRLPGAWPVAGGRLVLHVWLAELTDGQPAPLQDHSELRWVPSQDLDTVDWLPQDRAAAWLLADELTPDGQAPDGSSTPEGGPTPEDTPTAHVRRMPAAPCRGEPASTARPVSPTRRQHPARDRGVAPTGRAHRS